MDDNDVHMIRGDECGPNFLTFVSQLRKTVEKLQPGNYPARSNVLPMAEKRKFCVLQHYKSK